MRGLLEWREIGVENNEEPETTAGSTLTQAPMTIEECECVLSHIRTRVSHCDCVIHV